MTFLKRTYLIFILLPVAICYALLSMLWVIISHLYSISILRTKKY
jgi:hypothetical protein